MSSNRHGRGRRRSSSLYMSKNPGPLRPDREENGTHAGHSENEKEAGSMQAN